MGTLTQLVDRVRRQTELPAVDPERCVHSRLATATCQLCAASCPEHAWHLDDENLSIDVDACDGCGLCAAACPEGAIEFTFGLESCGSGKEDSALYACEYTGIKRSAGVLPCIHALGLRQLLDLYHSGVRVLTVSTADCDTCPRGRHEVKNIRLTELTRDVNRMLKSRGLEPLEVCKVDPRAWAQAVRSVGPVRDGEKLSRRGFLKRTVYRAVKEGIDQLDSADSDGSCDVPAGLRLGPVSAGDVLPYVPSIDGGRCNGCDACANVCPHGALSIRDDAYILDPAHCTGCMLCVDVCDQAAVSVAQWEAARQFEQPLYQGVCQACGAKFHAPVGQPGPDRRCRICRKTNHAARLYQVYK